MATISARLRAAIVTGAVGLLPSMAFADTASGSPEATAGVPDHAAAEAHRVGDTNSSSIEAPPGVPDHATAEARSQAGTPSSSEATDRVPDHATAENRGAEAE